ncbi:MAG: hypothetical protein ABJB05_13860 [Parafilimonas sp.]
MKNAGIICLLILLQSCVASSKWQKKYYTKKANEFGEKYSFGKPIEFNVNCSITKSMFDKQTKREVKKNVRCFELSLATIPDSTSQHNNVIDSFYTNKNKIQYIEKHSLKTDRKHFIS